PSLTSSLQLSPSTLRRPPYSPPFPYTTLFRSESRQRSADHYRYRQSDGERGHADGGARLHDRRRRDGGNRPHRDCGCRRLDVAEDRKSTRLNSSHSQISYAVFCLKKKNHNII